MGAKASTHEWGPDIAAICLADGSEPDDKRFPREVRVYPLMACAYAVDLLLSGYVCY